MNFYCSFGSFSIISRTSMCGHRSRHMEFRKNYHNKLHTWQSITIREQQHIFKYFLSVFFATLFFTLQSVLIFYYLTIELADRKNIATTLFNHLPMNVEKVIYSLCYINIERHRDTQSIDK